ncbi:hypothetical protein QJS66_16455 [Kocuria rhizophila]|nr:hypothetical protein QJS66_16455 [Kocuria rhizophila]
MDPQARGRAHEDAQPVPPLRPAGGALGVRSRLPRTRSATRRPPGARTRPWCSASCPSPSSLSSRRSRCGRRTRLRSWAAEPPRARCWAGWGWSCWCS